MTKNPNLVVVGHPYAPIGMGEHFRSMVRSLDHAGMKFEIHDVYRYHQPSQRQHEEFGSHQTDALDHPIRIFVFNGDEVEGAMRVLTDRSGRGLEQGYNIIYPAWELNRYPEIWAEQLDKFDEVWGLSSFTNDAFAASLKRPVYHMSCAGETRLANFASRRSFDIPEHRFAILFFFDVLSYATRKNPWAAIEVFKKLLKARPFAQAQLVLKVSNLAHSTTVSERLDHEVAPLRDRLTLITDILPTDAVGNLIRVCDCFLSIHRSEGFGRGCAEAMWFERPVVATGWSGNMDFMTPDVSFPVRYRMIPLENGDYPHWEDQYWADPDLDEAANILIALIDDPQRGIDIGRRAGRHMRGNFSYRAQGLRYRTRLDRIRQNLG